MSKSHQKVLAKLRRLQLLAESAGSEGERAAAEAARRRLVERLEQDGVHVAPELVEEVGAVSPDEAIEEDIPLDDFSAHSGSSPRTVVASAPSARRRPAAAPPPVFGGAASHRPSPGGLSSHPAPRVGGSAAQEMHPPVSVRTPPAGVEPQSGLSGDYHAFRQEQPTVVAPPTPDDDATPRTPVGLTAVPEPVPVETVAHTAEAYGYTPPTAEVPVDYPAETFRVASRRPRRAEQRRSPPSELRARKAKRVWYRSRLAMRLASIAGGLVLIWIYFAPVDPADAPFAQNPITGARLGDVNASIRQCLFGVTSACSSLGATIIDETRGAKWAPWEQRSACGEGDLDVCAALGRRFATENQRRLEGDADRQRGSVDLFSELACALRASSCFGQR